MASLRPLLTPEERRARRVERREKQRAANLGRAKKMHAARREFEAEVKGKSTVVGDSSSKTWRLPRINIGCSGWFYWHWKGQFYPAEIKTSDWFQHYASQFNTVELNAPFYSWPTVAAVQSWVRQARERPFIYTVKVCELITHIKRFSRTAVLVKDFGLIADILQSHMGCFLFQLPPSFHYTLPRLTRILKQLDPARRNVVEFRHRSWWNKTVYRALEKAGTIFCSCSGPRLPDELIQTHEEIYVRFHGTTRWYRHDYTSDELAVWTKRIKACNPKHVWAYFNNDRDGNAIRNAQELTRQLKGLKRSTNRLKVST